MKFDRVAVKIRRVSLSNKTTFQIFDRCYVDTITALMMIVMVAL